MDQPKLNPHDIETYCANKSLQPKMRGDQINCKICPNCERSKPTHGKSENYWKLYLRTDTGAFYCQRCHWKGSFYELKLFFGDAIPVTRAQPRKAYPKADPAKVNKYPVNAQKQDSVAMRWLESRGIKRITAMRYNIGETVLKFETEPERWTERTCATFPYQRKDENGRLETIFVKARDPEVKANMRREPAGAESFFFGWHLVDKSKKTIILTEGECFPGDVEVLTKRGWISFKEYQGEDVVQVDRNGRGSISTPLAVVKKPFKGMLKKYASRDFNFSATPEHNVVVLKNGEMVKTKISDLKKDNYTIPRVCSYEGTGIPLSDAQLALCVAVSADFKIDPRKNGRYAQASFKKQRKKDRIVKILDACGIAYTTYEQKKEGFTSFNIHLPDWCPGRFFPFEWLTQLHPHQREFLIEELVHWDGNKVNGKNQYEYSTKHEENAKWVQTLSHLSNRCSTIIDRENEFGKWKKVSILHNKKTSSFQHKNWTEIEHDDFVYCVQVQSGMFIARQNGKIFVTGNCDAMVIYQETGLNVVSLPNGSRSFPEEMAAHLNDFETIVVAMDDDTPGREGAMKVVERLGRKRCYMVSWRQGKIDGPKDANDALRKGHDIGAILESGEQVRHEHVKFIDEFKGDVLAEFLDPEAARGLQGTTIPGFNKLIGGFRLGELSIYSGLTGSGKTTLLQQLSLDYANLGMGTLWGSFEVRNKKLLKRMVVNHAGIDFNERQKLSEFDSAWQKFADLPIYLLDFYGATELQKILDAIDYSIDVYDVRHIVIDNMQFLMGAVRGNEKFDMQDVIIGELRNLATKRSVHISLICHPRKVIEGKPLTENDLFGSGRVSQDSDNVFCVQTHGDYPYVECRKNREMGARTEGNQTMRVYYRFVKELQRIVEIDISHAMRLDNMGKEKKKKEEKEQKTTDTNDRF